MSLKVNAMSYAKLIALMLEGEYPRSTLAEFTGLSRLTVDDYVRELHKQKAAHICRIEADALGRMSVKIFKIGRGVDAKSKPLTATQRSANRRERKVLRERWIDPTRN